MPVFVHTVDVVLLCLDRFHEWQDRFTELCLEAVVLGALVHDLSKASARENGGISHSVLMCTAPDKAAREAIDALEETSQAVGIRLPSDLVEHIGHIVMSHHGKWGRVLPGTAEALLVHQMDYFSAMHNRCAPVDANDIIPLLRQGYRGAEIASRLGVSVEVVRSRLKEACRAEGVSEWICLLPVWEERGYVATGSPEHMARIGRVRALTQLARQAPQPIIDAIARM